MTAALTFDDIANLAPKAVGAFTDVACPACGPDCKTAFNRKRDVLRIWRPKPYMLSFCCQRCGAHGQIGAGGEAVFAASAGTVTKQDPTDAERTAKALQLWNQAKDPAGTAVDVYLQRRGVSLPPGAAGEAIRWHASAPFGKGHRVGVMLALVRDIATDAPKAVHRTALTPSGHKASVGGNSRLSLGPISGGAVKLTPDADLGLGFGVGEGVETTLSLRNLDGCENLGVWSLLAANQLAAFPVLPAIEGLWVAVDHDLTGLAAAEATKARWIAAGRDVVTARTAAEGYDLNDVARRA